MIDPEVSVCVITYNQEMFIEETLGSIFSQKTNFPFEVIISNDGSTDNTSKQIRKLIKKNPSNAVVRFYDQEKNLGIIKNFQFVLNEARGKYIAICEGDDYWTDANKLQKQYNYLSQNVEYIGHAHNTEFIGFKTGKFSNKGSREITKDELVDHRPFHTATLFFNSSILKTPFVPDNVISGDRTLFLHLAGRGMIWYENEVMAVYRKNADGISNNVTVSAMKRDLNMISFFKSKNLNLPYSKLRRFIFETILLYPQRYRRYQLVLPYFKYIALCIVTGHIKLNKHKRIIWKILIS